MGTSSRRGGGKCCRSPHCHGKEHEQGTRSPHLQQWSESKGTTRVVSITRTKRNTIRREEKREVAKQVQIVKKWMNGCILLTMLLTTTEFKRN